MFKDIYFRQNVHCQQATTERERERESTRDYQLVGNSHLAKDLSCGESSELWGNLSFPTNMVMGIFGFCVFYLLKLTINLSFLRKSPQVCKIYHCRCYHSTVKLAFEDAGKFLFGTRR